MQQGDKEKPPMERCGDVSALLRNGIKSVMGIGICEGGGCGDASVTRKSPRPNG